MPRACDVTAVPPFFGVGFTDRFGGGKRNGLVEEGDGCLQSLEILINALSINIVPLLYISEFYFQFKHFNELDNEGSIALSVP